MSRFAVKQLRNDSVLPPRRLLRRSFSTKEAPKQRGFGAQTVLAEGGLGAGIEILGALAIKQREALQLVTN